MRGIPFNQINFAHSIVNAEGNFSFYSPLREKMTFIVITKQVWNAKSFMEFMGWKN